jgi:hypothetical protein
MCVEHRENRMAVAYKELKIASFTESEFRARGVTNVWGSNWVFASGGLQNDLLMAAQLTDDWKANGITPDASGVANFGTDTLPLNTVRGDSITAGTIDSSGGFFIFGDDNDAATDDYQIYRIQVDGGTLQAVAVGSIGAGNSGS